MLVTRSSAPTSGYASPAERWLDDFHTGRSLKVVFGGLPPADQQNWVPPEFYRQAEQTSVMHVHPDLELQFVVSGWSEAVYNGRIVRYQTGQVGLFWAGLPHQTVRRASDTKMMWLYIPFAWLLNWSDLENLRHYMVGAQVVLENLEGESFHAEIARWREWLWLSQGDSAEHTRILSLSVQAKIRLIALKLLPAAGHQTPLTPASARRVEAITNFLCENFQKNISLAQIARSVDLTAPYASTIFKSACGFGIWDYLTRLRVSYGQNLLLTSDLTLDQIARDCGFASANRFHQAFTKTYGIAPGTYRSKGFEASI